MPKYSGSVTIPRKHLIQIQSNLVYVWKTVDNKVTKQHVFGQLSLLERIMSGDTEPIWDWNTIHQNLFGETYSPYGESVIAMWDWFYDFDFTEFQRCERCGRPCVFMREHQSLPPEGEVCSVCDRWLCIDCIDWKYSGIDEDYICKDCSPNEYCTVLIHERCCNEFLKKEADCDGCHRKE